MALIKLKNILIIFCVISHTKSEVSNFFKLEKDPGIQENAIQLLRSCFDESLNTIIVTEDFVDMLHRSNINYNPVSIISTNNEFKTKTDREYLPRPATFVLSAKSNEEFQATLSTLKSSSWWDINSLFIIVGNLNTSCDNASIFLNIAYKMNLLISLFLCYEFDGTVMLYSYNPYTNRAPYPWNAIGNPIDKNQRWTLYKQPFTTDQEICSSLDFDKTKYMDGFTIKFVASSDRSRNLNPGVIYNIKSLTENHYPIPKLIFTNLFSLLNITVDIYYDSRGSESNGKWHGYILKLMKGLYDITIDARPLKIIPNIKNAYPVATVSARILTSKRDFLSPFEKISEFYGTDVIILSCIVFFITFLVIAIYNGGKYLSAALEILRMILSTGNISSFLTKPTRHSIDTLKMARDFKYTIYMPEFLLNYLPLDESRFKYNIRNYDYTCYDYIKNKSTNACIGTAWNILNSNNQSQTGLHISEKNVADYYITFRMRNDFPLEDKINKILLRLMQSGLIGQCHEVNYGIPIKKLHSIEVEETSARYRPINLKDVDFAFKFLALGLAGSFFVFIIEMLLRVKASVSRKRQTTLCAFK